MAVHDLLAGVADWLLREAVSYDLGAPLPSAPPLLTRDTHDGCDWFTGMCSVPDPRDLARNRNRSYCEVRSRAEAGWPPCTDSTKLSVGHGGVRAVRGVGGPYGVSGD